MKKISKAMVEAWLKENQDFTRVSDKELQALHELHEGKDSCFIRVDFSAVNVEDQEEEKEKEENFSASFETFKNSLTGSKWEKIITAENADFIKKQYRMLSATMVQGVFDFAYNDAQALKDAQKAGIFDDLRFYKDHNFSVDSIVGLVGKSTFDSKSDVVGVNNDVFVSRTFDPAFADKFDKEIVDAVSVGINFAREKSHNFEDPYDFYALLGKEVDGSIVRFLVTDITKIRELSSVSEGADPYAKLIPDKNKPKTDVKVNDLSSEETTDADFKKVTDNFQLQINDLTKELAEVKENLALKEVDLNDLVKKLESSKELLDLQEEFSGKLKQYAEAGRGLFSKNKEELLKFLRITNRTAMAVSIDNEQDFATVNSIYDIFKEEISSTFVKTCPSCNAEVEPTLQNSREDLSCSQLVIDRPEENTDALDEFCNNVHNV